MKIGKILFLFGLIIFLSACGDKIDTNMSEEVADFEFTTQDNEKFGLEDLEDEWWIAYFMYTNCMLVCPTTTTNMLELQKELQGSNIQIVSFTVDPDYDTPEVLKKYAEENRVDLDNWTFLTGYDYDTIKKLSEGSFKAVLENGGPDEMELSHTYNFFLINPDAKIIKKYNGMSMDEVDVLIEDAKTVLN